MTANGIWHTLQAEARGVSSKPVCTASRAWCCLTCARPSAWVKACWLGRSQKKLRNLLKVNFNSRGSGKEAVWINSEFLLMPRRSLMTASYPLQPPLEKWSSSVKTGAGGMDGWLKGFAWQLVFFHQWPSTLTGSFWCSHNPPWS